MKQGKGKKKKKKRKVERKEIGPEEELKDSEPLAEI